MQPPIKKIHNGINLQVKVSHQRRDDYLEDFCDASKAIHHSLFADNGMALQLILYFDELEICNPLGSARKKHKLGMVCVLEYCDLCVTRYVQESHISTPHLLNH